VGLFRRYAPLGSRAHRFALADSGFYLIDHKARHSIEEFTKDLLSLSRQRSFPKSTSHQAHPSVADSLIYKERRMPRAEARMASLFDVSLRPSEPTDQEISEALLGTWEIPRRVHGPQKIILRDLSIEGGDQARETFRANDGINFKFLHVLSSPYLLGSRHRQKGLCPLLVSVLPSPCSSSIFTRPSPHLEPRTVSVTFKARPG
jgi:hypothetical protein